MTSQELDQLVAEVMAEHLERKDLCDTIPLKRRGFKRRPRPKTEIIALAAKDATEIAEWVSVIDKENLRADCEQINITEHVE